MYISENIFTSLFRMATAEMIQRLKSRADNADEIIAQLKHQLSLIKQAKGTNPVV